MKTFLDLFLYKEITINSTTPLILVFSDCLLTKEIDGDVEIPEGLTVDFIRVNVQEGIMTFYNKITPWAEIGISTETEIYEQSQ